MSHGVDLNVYVAGEFVSGLMEGHFFHRDDLAWMVPFRILSNTEQAALNILDIHISICEFDCNTAFHS